MKRVLYDDQIFTIQRFGGISRYFCELMKHSQGLFNYSTGGLFSNNFYANELGFHKKFPIRFKFIGKRHLQKCLREQDLIKKIKQANIIHPTYYDPYLIKKTNKPIVLTVYDMIRELFPDKVIDVYDKKSLIEHSSQIIAISQNTKKDILKIYPQIPEEKISVVHLGTSWDVFEEMQKKQDYILFTGDRAVYKNFNNFIFAVAPLLRKYNLMLKCTGHPFTNEETYLLKQQNVFDKTSIEFADERELKSLYANALCFVFPSLYEGFGIPILEAFACCCPIVCSNTSCFPEIAENAAEYFNPNSIDDMREKIDRVICSETLREKLVSKGLDRLKAFSWQKCTEQTSKIYEKAML